MNLLTFMMVTITIIVALFVRAEAFYMKAKGTSRMGRICMTVGVVVELLLYGLYMFLQG